MLLYLLTARQEVEKHIRWKDTNIKSNKMEKLPRLNLKAEKTKVSYQDPSDYFLT
jgi:hypothetical protein